MVVISSSDLLKEFTIHANKIVDDKEIAIVQRANGKNLVFMSMDNFNEMQKKIFDTKKSLNKEG